jgi:hypothetical protein
MAKIPGTVGLGGKIAPKDENDKYPVTDPRYGLGGLRTVANLTERNSIPYPRREVGMLVYVTSESGYFKMLSVGVDGSNTDSSNWELLNTGTVGDIDAGTY